MIHVCVAEKKAINTALVFRRESAMVVVIAPIYPFKIGKQAELKEIEYAVALAGLHELVEILVGKAKAHAEVEKKSCLLIFKEDLVAADLVDSSVKREGDHTMLAVQMMLKSIWFLVPAVRRSSLKTGAC
jgi:hypothetical protein